MTTNLLFLLPLLGLAMVTTLPAASHKIRIVTSVPELAEFARAIGGDLVEAESLATGVEDMHGVPMKPSFVPKLGRADVVVVLGLEAEHAFMPALLEASKNAKIQTGKPGYIDCSARVSPLEVPKSLSRAEGEIHPAGNPHYNLDPVQARSIVQTMTESLTQSFPPAESPHELTIFFCANYFFGFVPRGNCFCRDGLVGRNESRFRLTRLGRAS